MNGATNKNGLGVSVAISHAGTHETKEEGKEREVAFNQSDKNQK